MTHHIIQSTIAVMIPILNQGYTMVTIWDILGHIHTYVYIYIYSYIYIYTTICQRERSESIQTIHAWDAILAQDPLRV